METIKELHLTPIGNPFDKDKNGYENTSYISYLPPVMEDDICVRVEISVTPDKDFMVFNAIHENKRREREEICNFRISSSESGLIQALSALGYEVDSIKLGKNTPLMLKNKRNITT